MAKTTTLSIDEAREALAAAEAAAALEQQQARRDAERQAQVDHDRAHAPIVADLERQTAEVLNAAASQTSGPIARDASFAARRYLLGIDANLEAATRHDSSATILAGHAVALGAQYERLASFNHPRYRAGDRRVGPDLAQRIADAERATWGALLRRLRVITGEG